MSTSTSTNTSCDNCGKKVATNSSLNIVTSKSEEMFWQRIHVKIINHSGVHNDGETRDADLCKKCAVKLLADALKRVRQGERASAGTEEIKQQGWERP